MSYAPYDYDYEYEQDKPWEIRELEKKLEQSHDCLVALYEELTSENAIDLNAVSFYMGEMASKLDVDENRFGHLTIQRNTKIVQLTGV